MSLTEEEREQFNRSFGRGNPNFSEIDMQNKFFLRAILNHMNDLLRVQGHVTVNDVYQAIGLPTTDEGRTAGWTGDTYVSFGDVPRKDSSFPLTFNINTTNVFKEIVK